MCNTWEHGWFHEPVWLSIHICNSFFWYSSNDDRLCVAWYLFRTCPTYLRDGGTDPCASLIWHPSDGEHLAQIVHIHICWLKPIISKLGDRTRFSRITNRVNLEQRIVVRGAPEDLPTRKNVSRRPVEKLKSPPHECQVHKIETSLVTCSPDNSIRKIAGFYSVGYILEQMSIHIIPKMKKKTLLSREGCRNILKFSPSRYLLFVGTTFGTPGQR